MSQQAVVEIPKPKKEKSAAAITARAAYTNAAKRGGFSITQTANKSANPAVPRRNRWRKKCSTRKWWMPERSRGPEETNL